MARTKTVFRCTECGATEPKWAGRCSGCEAWGTLLEEVDGGLRPDLVAALPPATPPQPISEVDPSAFAA
ncbi:MAG: DNA repair protein RadA, partial [Acidimicrobiales bacterium]|nr:DNA repair protein RadA [Acidimicrobiales bacterium]